jgi:hypothetical protein
MFAIRSGLAGIAGCCFTVGLLVACGNQSANAPPSNAASSNAADAQASPQPVPPPPASATQPPEGQQNASVAELLAGSTAPANPPPPAEPVAAPVAEGSGPVADDAAGAPVEFARVISVQKMPGPKQICTYQTVVDGASRRTSTRWRAPSSAPSPAASSAVSSVAVAGAPSLRSVAR